MMYKLPREAFDALKSSIGKYGIGGGKAYTCSTTANPIPCCVVGHGNETGILTSLTLAGLTVFVSDNAVQTVNERKGSKKFTDRITWDEYQKELNLQPLD